MGDHVPLPLNVLLEVGPDLLEASKPRSKYSKDDNVHNETPTQQIVRKKKIVKSFKPKDMLTMIGH